MTPVAFHARRSKARFWHGGRCCRLWTSESGQTLVLAALCLTILVGMLGLGVDAGVLRFQKRRMQMLADASAMAGALEISACAGTANCAVLQTAAKDALTENGVSSTLLTNCATSNDATLHVTVNNPPCAVSGDPNKGSSSYVETIVSGPVSTVFAKVLGVNSVNIAARAEAYRPPSPCVYFLSRYSSQPSLYLTNQNIQSTCPYYLGASYSFSGSGSSTGSPYFVAGSSSASTGSVSPAPTFNSPVVADPLGALSAPSYGSCTYKNYSVTQAATLQPGTYCGGLNINTSATVTLAAGTYVILGALTINGPTLNGSGVTFYVSQGNGYSYGASSIQSVNATLTAPTSGTLQGILYFSDPNLPNGNAGLSVSNWNAGSRLDGILYLPGQELTVSNVNLQGNHYFGVVADYASMHNASFNPSNDYSTLANRTPFTSLPPAATLVQ